MMTVVELVGARFRVVEREEVEEELEICLVCEDAR